MTDDRHQRMGREHRIARLTWPEAAARAPASVGLLPVGAACKEHGRHLPLATDLVQAEWIAGETASRIDALLWPTLTYGHYPAFTAYPGSVSIAEATFENTLVEILEGMARAGHRCTAVINAGISTIAAIDRACAGDGRRVALHLYRGVRFLRTAARLARQRGGGHADELETSLMLYIAPHLVRMEQAEDASATTFTAGVLNRDDPHAANYSPSGAMGNPLLANAEKGRVLAQAMVEDVLAALPAR